MKTCITSLMFALVLASAHARLIAPWPYPKLVDGSDLVAVVEVSSIEKTNAVFEGRADPDRFQGHVAHLQVAWVIKGDPKTEKLDLLFFTYSDGHLIGNDGALFLVLQVGGKCQYLVFLRRDKSGCFVPVSGQYDAAISVKEIKQDSASRPGGIPLPSTSRPEGVPLFPSEEQQQR
jgi:hypothetical protein